MSTSATSYISHLQKVISDMKSRLKDPDLARLFENTFPNTLGAYLSSVCHGRCINEAYDRHDREVL